MGRRVPAGNPTPEPSSGEVDALLTTPPRSPMRIAWMMLSYASWPFSEKKMIQPASRMPITSEWSQ